MDWREHDKRVERETGLHPREDGVIREYEDAADGAFWLIVLGLAAAVIGIAAQFIFG